MTEALAAKRGELLLRAFQIDKQILALRRTVMNRGLHDVPMPAERRSIRYKRWTSKMYGTEHLSPLPAPGSDWMFAYSTSKTLTPPDKTNPAAAHTAQ